MCQSLILMSLYPIEAYTSDQITPTHDQPTHKGIAQVREGKIHHTRLAPCVRKHSAKDQYGVPVWVRNTEPSVAILILTACNVVVNTSFIGTYDSCHS